MCRENVAMAQSTKKQRRLLMDSLESRTPVRVLRQDLDDSRVEGLVIGLTDTWVVLEELIDGIFLDGVEMLRLDLVTKVEVSQKTDYITRAHADLGVVPRQFPCRPQDAARELLEIVDSTATLMSIHLELWNDEACYIGAARRFGPKRLDLQFINPDGTWDDFSDRWRFDRITRIEYGSRYIEALERWGDPVPDDVPTERVKR